MPRRRANYVGRRRKGRKRKVVEVASETSSQDETEHGDDDVDDESTNTRSISRNSSSSDDAANSDGFKVSHRAGVKRRKTTQLRARGRKKMTMTAINTRKTSDALQAHEEITELKLKLDERERQLELREVYLLEWERRLYRRKHELDARLGKICLGLQKKGKH
eukprot:763767-Hanusia_phi.AAC.2